MSTSELDIRLQQLMPLVVAVCRRLRDEVHRTGFEPGEINIGGPRGAQFWLDKDPASGESSLMGEWRDDTGAKMGLRISVQSMKMRLMKSAVITSPLIPDDGTTSTRRAWFGGALTLLHCPRLAARLTSGETDSVEWFAWMARFHCSIRR